MSRRALKEPILDGGVQSVNFFNGRILTGADMLAEQHAHRRARHRLGTCVGEGVAYGLNVEGSGNDAGEPVVTVSAGVAINRRGEVLELPQDIELSLSEPVPQRRPTDPPVFRTCEPAGSDTFAAGSGVYLLTIAPAERFDGGRAPVAAIGRGAATCAWRFRVEGATFYAHHDDYPSSWDAQPDRLRNRLAHRYLFGSDDRFDRLIADPLSISDESYGHLPSDVVSDCEVPLALVHWTAPRPGVAGGIAFVDRWSVRRRLISPATSDAWTRATGDRRGAIGEAAFLQFQEQVRDLQSAPSPQDVAARDHFVHLPPAGVIPLRHRGRPGFRFGPFFGGIPTREEPIWLEGAQVEPLLRESLAYPPVDLSGYDDPTQREMLWVYRVRQNQPDGEGPHPYLVFTSGHVPPRGHPRADVARVGYATLVT